MKIPKFETLEEAKQYLRDNWEKGADCPCCTQRVQLYKHKLPASSVFALIRLYKLGEGYHHVRDFAEGLEGVRRSSMFAELRYWGVVEDKANEDPTKRKSGLWKITEKGKDFVEEKIKLPSYVRLFDGNAYGVVGDEISVREALGNKFNYEEMMNGF